MIEPRVENLVSVIITCYNRPNLGRKAIQSVVDQSYKNWELFIMDDNSNAETREVLKSFLTDERVHYWNSNIEESARFANNRVPYAENINVALETMCRGQYITYLTDDDYYRPVRLAAMTQYIREHSEVDVVFGKQRIFRGEQDGLLRAHERVLDWAPGTVDHCSFMHTYEALKKAGGKWPLDSLRAGDAHFFAALHQAGYKFYPCGVETDVHYYHHNELSSKIDRGELLQEPRE